MFKRCLALFGIALVGCVVFQTSIFADDEGRERYLVKITNGDETGYSIQCLLTVREPLSVDYNGKPNALSLKAMSDEFASGKTVIFNVTSAKDAATTGKQGLFNALSNLKIICSSENLDSTGVGLAAEKEFAYGDKLAWHINGGKPTIDISK